MNFSYFADMGSHQSPIFDPQFWFCSIGPKSRPHFIKPKGWASFIELLKIFFSKNLGQDLLSVSYLSKNISVDKGLPGMTKESELDFWVKENFFESKNLKFCVDTDISIYRFYAKMVIPPDENHNIGWNLKRGPFRVVTDDHEGCWKHQSEYWSLFL